MLKIRLFVWLLLIASFYGCIQEKEPQPQNVVESADQNDEQQAEQKMSSSSIATMQDDGSIRLVVRTTGKSGLSADVVITYKPEDEDYDKLLKHVGGLKKGETKVVPPGFVENL